MEKTRLPVVAVLGHVDHGKTTLLDAIRKTDIASHEVGSITQSIGASQVEVSYEGEKRKITFIDTPGHEAFLAMRSRGVSASDIAILVVAANEGVKPQTKESIKYLKESHIPFIVAVTKSDLPNIDPERIKQQLAKEGVTLEELGGEIPCVLVSAKKEKGVKELLDLVLLVWEMQEKKIESDEFLGVIIESKLDPKRGIVATVAVKNGELRVGEEIVAGTATGKVRALINDKSENLKQIYPGDAIEILGFSLIPSPGEIVKIKKEEVGLQELPPSGLRSVPTEVPSLLSLILKAESLGAIEAITNLLPKEVLVVARGSGEISEGDILQTKAQNAMIVGFNVKVRKEVLKLATAEKVVIKQYHLIYELIEEIKEIVEGLKTGSLTKETILGKATVLASFPHKKTQILGLQVSEGRIALGDKVKLLRGETEIGKSVITSMRRMKEEIKAAEKNAECGVILSPVLDFAVGDVLISYRT